MIAEDLFGIVRQAQERLCERCMQTFLGAMALCWSTRKCELKEGFPCLLTPPLFQLPDQS